MQLLSKQEGSPLAYIESGYKVIYLKFKLVLKVEELVGWRISHEVE